MLRAAPMFVSISNHEKHDLVDKQFDRLNVSATNRKLNNFKTNISNVAGQGEKGGAQTLYREREKLVRAYESMKNEIKTYENNLGFLTSSSKKGNSLVTELNRKVEKLKSDLELTLEKIKVIDQSTKQINNLTINTERAF